MEIDNLDIDCTQPFALINRVKDMVVTCEKVGQKRYKIVEKPFHPQNVDQLFFIIKQQNKKQCYRFVHLKSNRILTISNKQIILQFQNDSEDQNFKIVKNPVEQINTYYWFKSQQDLNKSVHFEGELKCMPFRSTLQAQQFRLEPTRKHNLFKETCLLINKNKDAVLQIPKNKMNEVKLELNLRNERFNQRWFWIKQGKGYLIGNYLTDFYIDIQDEHPESGSRVVVRQKTGQKGQIWVPESIGNKIYRIRSAYVPSLFLSTPKESQNSQPILEVSDVQMRCISWTIEGALP